MTSLLTAIIDIGTNTAHLLIAHVIDDQQVRTIYKERRYTYLGEGGLEFIDGMAVNRLYDALGAYAKQIESYKIEEVKVYATDALRSAKNGPVIHKQISDNYNWTPKIISGQLEAKFIAKGVALALDKTIQNYLIMDIGGGSVEFILVAENEEILIESLPIGISRLHHNYQLSDPPNEDELDKIIEHIILQTLEIKQACQKLNEPISLIGSAGTFETFLTDEELNDHSITAVKIESREIRKRYAQVIAVPGGHWDELDWLPSARRAYIIGALLLITVALDLFQPKQVIVSKYALKEGAAMLG